MSLLSSIGSAVGAAANAVANVVTGGGNSTGGTVRDSFEYAGNDGRALVRDHRTPPRGVNWATEIAKPGGLQKLLEAVRRGDPAAKEFVESKEGSLLIQDQMQKDSLFFQTMSNLSRGFSDILKQIGSNIRA